MELISQISKAENPLPIIEEFVQRIVEDKSGLHGIYRRLFNALKSKKERQRGNIGMALYKLLHRMRSETDSHELYEQSKEVLLRDSVTVENRRSTLAALLAWNAMVKSGIFSRDSEDLLSMLRNCHGIANERLCYRTLGYNVLWVIISYMCKDTNAFREKIFDELSLELGPTETPGHADSFALWVKINKKYPGLPLKKWVSTPVNRSTMRALSSCFEHTIKWLPEVHHLWDVLAAHDHMQLVWNAKELWSMGEGQTNLLPMFAAIAALKVVKKTENIDHFLKLMEEHAEYFTYINTLPKYEGMLNDALMSTAEFFAEKKKHRLVAIVANILKCVRNGKQVSKLIVRLTDDQTKELIGLCENHDVDSWRELLWAQTRRENMEDDSIVTTIFKETMNPKRVEPEDIPRIVSFVAHVVDLVSPSGRHWFNLLSDDIPPVCQLVINSKEDVIARAKALIVSAQAVHKLLGLEEHEVPEMEESIEGVIALGSSLTAKKCELCKEVGRSIAMSAMPYADESQLDQLANDGLLLVKALTIPELCAKAIPRIVKKVSSLPRTITSRPENLHISINAEGAEEALPSVLEQIKLTSAKGFLKELALRLIDQLSDEQSQAQAEAVIEEQLGLTTQVDLLPLFMKKGQELANFMFDSIVAKVEAGKKGQAVLKKARVWLDMLSERYEFDAVKIGNAVGVMTNNKYGEGRGARKRAEDALGWAVQFVANQRKEIPLDSIQGLLKEFESSKSRILQALAQRLLNPTQEEE